MPGHRSDDVRRPARELPSRVRRAAAALSVPLDSITVLGGATGSSWACGEHVLRVGASDQVRREVRAMTAASSAVPVPEVLDIAELTDDEERLSTALLLRRLPGRPAAETTDVSVSQARRVGETCGRLHADVAAVAAPEGLLVVQDLLPAACRSAGAPRLLHLDLHPFNVLVHEGEVTGVIDWANAAGGPDLLDRVRSWSLLTLDPAARGFRLDPRGEALVEGWASAAQWDELPAEARVWACEYMLGDLVGRFPASGLDHVRVALDRARAASGRPPLSPDRLPPGER